MRKATKIMIAILAVFFIGTTKVQASFPDQFWGANIYQITDHSIEIGPALIDNNWQEAIAWRVFYDDQVTDWLPIDQYIWRHENLTENSWHSYQVQFIDAEDRLSALSALVQRATRVRPPAQYQSFANCRSIKITLPRFHNDHDGLSGYEFFNMTLERSSGWLSTNTWQDNNLTANTTYYYSLKYKNTEGFITDSFIIRLRTICLPSWSNHL